MYIVIPADQHQRLAAAVCINFILVQGISITAHSLRSFETQSSQRTLLFLFAEPAKKQRDLNKCEKEQTQALAGRNKMLLNCRRHDGFHFPASQRQMKKKIHTAPFATLR
jgi:hypothetical protein